MQLSGEGVGKLPRRQLELCSQVSTQLLDDRMTHLKAHSFLNDDAEGA
jgi:hypothetical protein